MITVRKSHERGHADHGWLNTYHTFSFNTYFDPDHMQFRSLRVLNEDRVAPGAGFPTHPHQNMEILTYVISGALAHSDGIGNESVLKAGEAQRMTAGSGITHSEYNASKTEPVHFLQIWLRPHAQNLEPGYEQKQFAKNSDGLSLIASPNGDGNALHINQDAHVYLGQMKSGDNATRELQAQRAGWVQVFMGTVTVNNKELSAGDGAAVEQEDAITITAKEDAAFLLFDLG